MTQFVTPIFGGKYKKNRKKIEFGCENVCFLGVTNMRSDVILGGYYFRRKGSDIESCVWLTRCLKTIYGWIAFIPGSKT